MSLLENEKKERLEAERTLSLIQELSERGVITSGIWESKKKLNSKLGEVYEILIKSGKKKEMLELDSLLNEVFSEIQTDCYRLGAIHQEQKEGYIEE